MTKPTNEDLVPEYGAIYTVTGVSIAKMDRDDSRTSPTERDANAKRFVQIWNLWPDVVEALEIAEANWGVPEGREDVEKVLKRVREVE